MQKLIQKLKKDSFAKPAPGKILNEIGEKRLKTFAKEYPHNTDALWIGAYIADMFITEAKASGDITKHVPMALNYAKEIIEKYKINKESAAIILEIIETHHGGKQKYIESKLFKNADCFKFLEPKGVFHIFGAFYDHSKPETFEEAINYTMFKVEEKYNLVDLDKETIEEAKELYTRWQYFFKRIGHKATRPKIYGKK